MKESESSAHNFHRYLPQFQKIEEKKKWRVNNNLGIEMWSWNCRKKQYFFQRFDGYFVCFIVTFSHFDSKWKILVIVWFFLISFWLTRLETRTKESNKFASIKSEKLFFIEKKMRNESEKLKREFSVKFRRNAPLLGSLGDSILAHLFEPERSRTMPA